MKRELSLYIGVRVGGGEGGCSPPKFWATQFFFLQEKIWAKPDFKDVSMLFNYFEDLNINLSEVSVIIQLHSHETVVA